MSLPARRLITYIKALHRLDFKHCCSIMGLLVWKRQLVQKYSMAEVQQYNNYRGLDKQNFTPPPHPEELIISKPRGDNKDNCNL